MIKYHIDANRLKQIITQRGYAHLTEFTLKNGLNRATMNNYLKYGPMSEPYYTICEALQVDPLSLLSPSPSSGAASVDDISEIMPVVKSLCSFDREIAVGLLGSRAKGNNRRYSDWDLCITRGRRPLTGEEFLRLKRTADDAVDRLPREVDFINMDAAPEWFLLGVQYEPVFLAGDPNSWSYFMGVLYGAKKGKED